MTVFYPQLQLSARLRACIHEQQGSTWPSFLTRPLVCRWAMLKNLRMLKVYFTISVAVPSTFWWSLSHYWWHSQLANLAKQFQFLLLLPPIKQFNSSNKTKPKTSTILAVKEKSIRSRRLSTEWHKNKVLNQWRCIPCHDYKDVTSLLYI